MNRMIIFLGSLLLTLTGFSQTITGNQFDQANHSSCHGNVCALTFNQNGNTTQAVLPIRPASPAKQPLPSSKPAPTNTTKTKTKTTAQQLSTTTLHIVHDSPSVSITLESNPTTGYQWVAQKYDDSLLTVTHKFLPSSSGRMGAPGKDEWTFTATQKALENGKPQTTAVTLAYLRSWEKNTPPAKTKTITININ